MDLKAFKTDAALEARGKWIEYGDSRFLIASANNPAYKKAGRKRVGKIPEHLLKANPEMAEKVIGDCMAEHVLLSWENVTDDGEPKEPTLENRKAALGIRAFREWVAEQATDIGNWQTEDEAGDVVALKSGD